MHAHFHPFIPESFNRVRHYPNYAESLFTLRLRCIDLNGSLLVGKIPHPGIWDSLVRDEPAPEGVDVDL